MNRFAWIHESGGTMVLAEDYRSALLKVIRYMAQYAEENTYFGRFRHCLLHFYDDHQLVELESDLE